MIQATARTSALELKHFTQQELAQILRDNPTKLGEGGSAHVYLGNDLPYSSKAVAVKQLKAV